MRKITVYIPESPEDHRECESLFKEITSITHTQEFQFGCGSVGRLHNLTVDGDYLGQTVIASTIPGMASLCARLLKDHQRNQNDLAIYSTMSFKY